MKNKFYLYCILCFLFNVAGYSQSTVFESLSFESNKLGRKVSYSIYLPSDYSTSKRNYPVLYLLHGYTDNETNWIQMGQMKTIADRAIANEEAVQLASSGHVLRMCSVECRRFRRHSHGSTKSPVT